MTIIMPTAVMASFAIQLPSTWSSRCRGLSQSRTRPIVESYRRIPLLTESAQVSCAGTAAATRSYFRPSLPRMMRGASFTPLPPCSSSTLRRLSKFAQHVTEVNEPPVPRFSSEPRFLLACRAGKKRRVASDGRTARNGGSDRECRIRPSDRHSSWRPPVGGGRSREPSPTEVRMGKSRSSVMRASRRRPQRGRRESAT